MPTSLDVLFTTAEFTGLAHRDLTQTVCVVFDVLRDTSTIVTALANGAHAVIPVAEIPDALALRKQRPEILLAGERDGLRIRAELTGGTEFDLGNSPCEFTAARIQGKTIVLSTTNGSRALRACGEARTVLIGAFLNLRATADYLEQHPAPNLLLVCSGTMDQTAYEDILGAGALAGLLWPRYCEGQVSDSATVARQIYRQNSGNLLAAMEHSRNARRLLAMPDLRDDVPWCLQRDLYSLIAKLDGHAVKKIA